MKQEIISTVVKFVTNINGKFTVNVNSLTGNVDINLYASEIDAYNSSLAQVQTIEQKLVELGYKQTYEYAPITITDGKACFSYFKKYELE